MTEIPMPGDYGTTEPPSQQRSEGCCSRSCRCCVFLVCGVILLIITLSVLIGMSSIIG